VTYDSNTVTFEAAARWVRAATHVVLCSSAVLFCVALVGLTTDIVMRYAFSSSVRGMQEIVNLLFTWIYMLGIAALYARNGDAAITFVARSLPLRAQIALALLVSLIIAASTVIVLVATLRLIDLQAGIASAELGIPEPLRFAPLALAAASITITSLIEAWACLIWIGTGVRPVIWRDSSF
jgi:TRAP-type C4-dicarboxylate transport system permease small subunit